MPSDRVDTSTVLTDWTFTAPDASDALVLPDGCQDIIERRRPGSRPTLFVSAFMSGPRRIRVVAGESFRGLRLRAGTSIDRGRLRRVQAIDERAFDTVIEHLDEVLIRKAAATEILEALAQPNVTPHEAAACLGVRLRAVQRVLREAQLPSPQFWTQLVRVRRAARAIRSDRALADLAGEYGFSDQAHMSREFRRWLAVSPRQLRIGSDEVFRLVQAAGYD